MSEELPICEAALLLMYDARKGRAGMDASPAAPIAAAVVLDLLVGRLVEESGGLLRAKGPAPTHPALAIVHGAIAASSKPVAASVAATSGS